MPCALVAWEPQAASRGVAADFGRTSLVGSLAMSLGHHVEQVVERHALEGAERWNEAIVVARRGRAGVVLLDRPESGNAHNRAMINALGRAWLHFKEDSEVRVVVIGSTTDRNFCTGIDLKEVAGAGGFGGLAEMTGFGPVLGSGQTHRDAGLRKPVLSAVEGRVIGGGLHWVAEADIVVAGENAVFRDTHVERGFVGDVGFGIWWSEVGDVVAALRRDWIERTQSEQRADAGDDRRSELGVRSHRQ